MVLCKFVKNYKCKMTNARERGIGRQLYESYGLTEEEIKVVEEK